MPRHLSGPRIRRGAARAGRPRPTQTEVVPKSGATLVTVRHSLLAKEVPMLSPTASMRRTAAALTLAASCGALAPAAEAAPPRPKNDPFYHYSGETPLEQVAPGTVLKTRAKPLHIIGIPTPIRMVQLLYRSTGQVGQPTVNVTSVLQPPVKLKTPRVLSYQSAYDSLSPDDQPSYALAGGNTFGGIINHGETLLTSQWLLAGYHVAVPDTEGQQANFAAGPEYGLNTLDGLRAALASPAVGLKATSKAGLIGYSGGAIATEWAAELAPTYAPDIDDNLVGAAMGGVLVSPGHNLHYIEGSKTWAGVAPMAIIGAARAYGVDITPYLSAYGLKIYNKMKKASISEVLGAYPGLRWKQLAKPEYPTAESIKIYVDLVNQLIMGTGGTPTTPLFIGQGAKGELEGTPGDKPGIGKGDGVMIAGDVRSLARQYCDAGTKVEYREYASRSHVSTLPAWLPSANGWLRQRFAGAPAPQNCATIAPGNPLDPIEYSGSDAAESR